MARDYKGVAFSSALYGNGGSNEPPMSIGIDSGLSIPTDGLNAGALAQEQHNMLGPNVVFPSALKSDIDGCATLALVVSESAEANEDTELLEKIIQLWSAHDKAAGLVDTTGAKQADWKKKRTEAKQSFKVLRNDLAGCLYTFKQRLARKGRGGGWSSFLSERGIPRTTADRLVKRHEGSLAPKRENAPHGAFSHLPTAEDVSRFVKGLAPKLSKLLVNSELEALFLKEVSAISLTTHK